MAQLGQIANLQQNLTLTQQMRRSLEVLQVPTLELREFVNQELNSNPLLEEIKESPDISLDSPEAAIAADSDERNKARDFFFNSIADKESFQSHLRTQAALELRDRKVLEAFNFLADYLDERGFIAPEAFEDAERDKLDPTDLKDALEFMQTCDPAGVGARDYRECFMIQLRRKHRENSLAYAILESHYELLQKRKIPELAKLFMVQGADIERAIREISELDMSPAKTFEDGDLIYINADLEFFKEGKDWRVRLTNDGVPKLRLDSNYREIIARGGLSKEDLNYFKEKTRDGKSLIEAIEMRQSTILKIGEVILERQRDFFERGTEFLRPLTMAQAAEIIGVHPTTVSRAVANKYALVDFKILPLKYFFASGFALEGSDGDEIANTSIKREIAEIIEGEDKSKPLSDGAIADILRSRDIDIARRTVAKYREQLNIPPKSMRKRFD